MPLYISLGREALAKLRRIAEQERRRPQDQAAVIIERALASQSGPDSSSAEHVGAKGSHEEAEP